MAVHVEPVGAHFRAYLPDPGPDGRRQIGYAVALGDGRYLVRLPGALARPVHGRLDAMTALRGAEPPS